MVARSGLTADHDGTWHHLGFRISLDAIVQCNDVQAVKQLTFVLVDTLNLDIEDRGRIDFDAIVVLENFGQLHLILLLDFHDGTLEIRILGPLFQLYQLFQVNGPFTANFL